MAILRGEIYFVDLSPVKGHEQAGLRPVLVISTDDLNRKPLVITVVIGTKGSNVTREYPSNIRVPSQASGLPLDTVFLCYQVRSLDHSRFKDPPAGKLPDAYMAQVEDALRLCYDL
jgi:mRNA interferase MazF